MPCSQSWCLFSIKKTIYSRSAKEVKKKLQTNAKKGFWSTNADLDFVGRGGHYFFAYCTTFVDFLCGTV